MSIRDDISIFWEESPRIIEVAAPSTLLRVQDLHDTLRHLAALPEAMDEDEIVDSSGKESLGSGVTPDPTGQTGALYVPLLDVLADAATEQSDNIIYTTPFDVRARVRKYGFKDFTLDTAFSASGVAVTAILQNDPQAT